MRRTLFGTVLDSRLIPAWVAKGFPRVVLFFLVSNEIQRFVMIPFNQNSITKENVSQKGFGV